MPYPVSIVVEPQIAGRNRLTTAVRPILAIPHAILVGPVWWSNRTGGVGLLGAVAYVTAVVSWFTIGVMRWILRVEAYLLLLVDEYPPFALE
jgi:hypothetical protein